MPDRKTTIRSKGERKKVKTENMQDLRPVASLIATSDWHFRLTTPRSRAEENWRLAQFETINQIAELSKEHNYCPVVIAGDVFDDGWHEGKCPPELINQAYEMLCLFSKVYVIAGQHDLPNHRYDLLHKSALHTLCLTGKAEMLHWDGINVERDVVLSGVSWGEENGDIPQATKIRHTEGKNKGKKMPNVIALHANIWHAERTKHKEAKEDEFTDVWRKKLAGYDVAVFGDNHKGFLVESKPRQCTIYNTGGPMNRNIDEKGVSRHIGLIYPSGGVEKHHLDTSNERWKKAEELLTDPAAKLASEDFITELAEVGPDFMDFCASVMRYLRRKEIREEVRQFVTQILKKAKEEKK